MLLDARTLLLPSSTTTLATYQADFALPFNPNVRKRIRLPGYLHLDLPQHVMQIVSRCRLRAHTLNVETASWDDGVSPPIVMRELVVDLRKRLRGVQNADALAEHGEHTNK
eukprot:982317-Pelagomonas_calceolata.AAC.1